MKCNASSYPGRRGFLKLSGLAALGSGLGPLAAATGLSSRDDPTHVLSIREAKVELAPGRTVTTLTYDGQLPGPLLRATVGRPVRVAVHNRTDRPERIHWHGQNIPLETPLIPARSTRGMQFIPQRPGLYFYHSEQIAALQLEAGLYSGQVGALLVEPPGLSLYRQQVLVLKDYGPSLHRTRRGCEVNCGVLTINGRTQDASRLRLPAGEPLLVHVLNASASQPMTLSLPGYLFDITALDGNPTPTPVRLPALPLHPGERIAAWVTRGVFDGHTRLRSFDRPAGLHNPDGPARPHSSGGPAGWAVHAGVSALLDYTLFDPSLTQRLPAQAPRAPDASFDVVLARHDAARSGINHWSINGTRFSTTSSHPLLQVERARRYRLRFHNTSDEALPMHLQRHRMEIVSVAGRPTAGVLKDVVAIGPHQQIEVDFTADGRGPALLRCTHQLQRDFGLMALVGSN